MIIGAVAVVDYKGYRLTNIIFVRGIMDALLANFI